jgi:endo-1,4-beta-xylanase
MGTVAVFGALQDDPVYAQTLAREYNIIALGVASTTFSWVQTSRTEFNFVAPDAMVDFAAAHGLQLGGPALVWRYNLPPWLINGKFSSSEVSMILKEYIQTMVRRYRGRVRHWGIAWDTFDNLGNMRKSFWSQTLGPDYVQQAFVWAREADPRVKLALVEPLGFEPLGPRSDATYALLQKFRAGGIPIDAISIGSAWLLDRLPKMQDVTANMNRLAALGLEIYVSGFEVSLPLPATDQDLQRQAAAYSDYLATCLSIASCKAFSTAGFTDKYSYAPERWGGMGVGAALPFDAAYKPKPAYKAMLDTLNARPSAMR